MIHTQDQQSNLHINAKTHEGGANDDVPLSIPTNNDGLCSDISATPGREAGAANEPSLLQRLCDRTFRTFDGTVFTHIETNRGSEMMSVRDPRFRSALRRMVQKETGKPPSQATLAASIESLETCASQGPVAEVHVRVAVAGGRIYLDLADDHGRVVEVGPGGWNVIDIAPVHFIRSPSMRPLPIPESGGSIDDLRSMVNVVDESDFVLIVASLLDALRNEGAHPVLVINGGEGAAKTTLAELLQKLIDPSWEPLKGLPQTERQLLASDRYLRVYDNVSSISPKLSDALCRMSTGTPAHKVIINGIGELVMRPDLSDRSILVNLAPVADRQRRSHQEIWATFERLRPKILGVLIDAVAHGLRALPTTQLDEMPRMADFAIWATACEGALWPKGTFMSAYMENRDEAVESHIETDVVAIAVRLLMAKRPTWTGTATELDGMLRVLTGNLENAKSWPAEPRILSTRLRSLAPSLCKLGIMVTFDKIGHDRKRVITLSTEEARADLGADATPAASVDGAAPEDASEAESGTGISSDGTVRSAGFEARMLADDAGAADAAERESQTRVPAEHPAGAETKPAAQPETAERSIGKEERDESRFRQRPQAQADRGGLVRRR